MTVHFAVLALALLIALRSIPSSLGSALRQRSSGNGDLQFEVDTGGNNNYFLRDSRTTAQVLLTSSTSNSSVRRLVVALPAGNSGALSYFLPLNSSSALDVTLDNSTLRSTTEDFDNVGVQANIAFSQNATMGVTIIGAVRAMRDYVEGSGTMHEIFNYTVAHANSTSLRLHRQWINATADGSFKSADLYLDVISKAHFNVTPGHNGTFTPPTVDIIVPDGQFGVVQTRFLTNESTIHGISTENLFLPAGLPNQTDGLNRALDGLSNGTDINAQQVSFLTFLDKFTAGGWRFLTYFGRDSMIALRFLMPLLAPNATEAALGAVIERANSTGALCHEETIGDYASFINIQNNQSDLGNQPFYDYKMIDTDLYFIPTLAHYFLDLPQGRGRASSFLQRKATLQNGTYQELLNRTVQYNLARALPFSSTPNVTNLLSFRPGQPVGNWRDSNEGTGYGPIPFDVNVALVPANLRATARLARSGILDNMVTLSNNNTSSTLADLADATADVWEEKAASFFEVSINGSVADDRLQIFVRAANLSEELLSDNGTAGIESGNAANKVFYALSLMEDGSPVEVLNSDLGFALLYGSNVTQQYLQRVVEALQPFPRGLLTNIGMVVANPAYDSNTTNIEVLNRAAYHGTVVWSWQQGLMASGIARQLGFCNPNASVVVDPNPAPVPKPTWCNNGTFVDSLVAAQQRLWTSIQGGKDSLFTEVWTYTFDNATNQFSPADLAVISPQGTESDAIQLWSYGFLGLLDPNGETIR